MEQMLNWGAFKLSPTKDQQEGDMYKDSSLQPTSRLGALTLDFQNCEATRFCDLSPKSVGMLPQ